MARLTAPVLLLSCLLSGCGERLPERVLWRLKFADVVAAPPALGPDGTVYVGSHDGTFCAVSPEGQRLWTQRAADFYHAPAAVMRDRLVVGTFDQVVYCYDLSGHLKWTFATHERVEAGAAVGRDQTIYVPGLDDNLYALGADGGLLWRYTAADDIGGSPAILSDGSVVVGDKSPAGNLYRLTPQGRLLWRVALGSPILSSPAVGVADTLYVTPKKNELMALTADGKLLWRYATEGALIGSPAVDAAGNCTFASYDGGLYSVDRQGRRRWVFRTFTPSSSSPALGAGGVVYYGADSHAVYAVSAADGHLLWKVPTSGYVASSPVIAPDGTLYIGCDDGYLYAIRTDSPGLDADAPWPHLRGGGLCLGRPFGGLR